MSARNRLRSSAGLFACAVVVTAAIVASATREAVAQCAGGSACPPCTMCRAAPASGTNPTVPEMSTLFDRIAAGPSVYGTLGWDFGSARTIGVGAGCCSGGSCTTVPARFPCILLKAIYLTESSWRQFCTTGQTVISFDCGYGIAQVTSGMRRGETSAFDPNRVAAEAAYNVSVGAAILAGKWRVSPCVGSNDADIIEHWYFAAWGYNGFAFSNNPNNPMFDAARMEFRTPGVASAQVRGNYPYQELVWGYAHYPLTAAHYTGIGLAYPRRSEICASCGLQSANIGDPAGSHRTTCPGGAMPDAGGPDVVTRPDVVVTPDVPTSDVAARDVVARDVGAADASLDAAVDVVVADASARDVVTDRGTVTPPEGACNCRIADRPTPSARPALLFLLLAALGAGTIRRRSRRGFERRASFARTDVSLD